MNSLFTTNAWSDYLALQRADLGLLLRVNDLLTAIMENPTKGPGQPEALHGVFGGCWTRRIDARHRLIYRVEGQTVIVLSCRDHAA
ncbi:Txe/YoeB family addiction module toxin [Levilactobacillus yonginensis]|uniref:Txe/YoeB family addiction module toxin n=1 Tax=Levilactobacillus yonginensis TaxID=1054041 RepID=UPI000F79B33B|nr:Txe/YoeB family addiction module toxin [Levilactobacillus yonginensis]